MEQGENVERGPVDTVRSDSQRASGRGLSASARELPASERELLGAPEVAAPCVAAPAAATQRPSNCAGAEAA